MRAKLAVAVAAFGVLLSQALPSIGADLNTRVSRILFGTSSPQLLTTVVGTTVITQPAVIATTDTMVIREIPAVLAPTSTGVAIITEIPSDVDIRREDLARRIGEASALGALSAGRAAELQTALGQVGSAEVQYRADGMLTYAESRRLYNAMDRIGSDLDFYTNPSSSTFLGVRLVPGV